VTGPRAAGHHGAGPTPGARPVVPPGAVPSYPAPFIQTRLSGLYTASAQITKKSTPTMMSDQNGA
jgi:hypothetical protein